MKYAPYIVIGIVVIGTIYFMYNNNKNTSKKHFGGLFGNLSKEPCPCEKASKAREQLLRKQMGV